MKVVTALTSYLRKTVSIKCLFGPRPSCLISTTLPLCSLLLHVLCPFPFSGLCSYCSLKPKYLFFCSTFPVTCWNSIRPSIPRWNFHLPSELPWFPAGGVHLSKLSVPVALVYTSYVKLISHLLLHLFLDLFPDCTVNWNQVPCLQLSLVSGGKRLLCW